MGDRGIPEVSAANDRRVALANLGRRWRLLPASAIVLLAALPYLAFLRLPLLSDDYLQTELARRFISWPGLAELAADPLYRCRATSLFVTASLYHFFGLSPLAYNIASILLHAANCLLIFSFGRFPFVGWKLAWLTAAVFAVGERHHEAVVWHAALPELLVLFFLLLALRCWLSWLQEARPSSLLGTVVAFFAALASKESAAILPVVLASVTILLRAWSRRALVVLVALAAVSGAYFLAGFLQQDSNQHWRDGTFAPSPAFLITLAASLGRALWPWGGLSILLLALVKVRRKFMILTASLGLAALCLLPYSFLSYMPRVPSRHHYLASVCVAALIASTVLLLQRLRPSLRPILYLAALAFLGHNMTYLWVFKRKAFEERAQPLEELVTFAQATKAPKIRVSCFPYSIDEAYLVLRFRAGVSRPEPHEPAPTFCRE